MNLASLLVNAVSPKLFHGWVRIWSLKSSNEHIEWNKVEAFWGLPCRARGGGTGPVSLGQALMSSYRFGTSNSQWRSASTLSVPTLACSAAGPSALHSSYLLSAGEITTRFNAMWDIMGYLPTAAPGVGRTHIIQSTKNPVEQSVPWG